MSIAVFIRMFLLPLAGSVVLLLVVLLLYRIVTAWGLIPNSLWSRRAIKLLLGAVWLGLAIAVALASHNLIPRSKIDCSDLNRQEQQWEQRHSTPIR